MHADGATMNDEPPPTRLCPDCGGALKLAIELLDQSRGRDGRVYRCLSGHVAWDTSREGLGSLVWPN